MTLTDWFEVADFYAKKESGCNKVAVGCAIVTPDLKQLLSLGANRGIPNLCKSPRGCLRIEKFGEDSKSHRNSGDCRAIHSEIDAISSAAREGISLNGSIAIVTRYPCENCAKALIQAGVRQIWYGGTAKTSTYTSEILDENGVRCYHRTDWKEDLSDR